MIKGINHSMIELQETENEYYERAILIIRPEYAAVQRSVLEKEALRMLHELDAPSVMQEKEKPWKQWLLRGGLLLLGVLLGCSFQLW